MKNNITWAKLYIYFYNFKLLFSTKYMGINDRNQWFSFIFNYFPYLLYVISILVLSTLISSYPAFMLFPYMILGLILFQHIFTTYTFLPNISSFFFFFHRKCLIKFIVEYYYNFRHKTPMTIMSSYVFKTVSRFPPLFLRWKNTDTGKHSPTCLIPTIRDKMKWLPGTFPFHFTISIPFPSLEDRKPSRC